MSDVEGGRVVVVGSANEDLVLTVEELPVAGETLLAADFERGLGGKGANQAVAAAGAGARVAFVGAVGTDAAGGRAARNLAEAGVDTSSLARIDDVPTGLATVTVDARGRNQIVVVPGANAHVSADGAAGIVHALASTDVVVVQCEIPVPVVTAVVAAAHAAGATLVLNLAPYTTLDPAVLARATVVVVNESEALALLGRAVPESHLAEALAARVGTSFVVTLGQEGSVHSAPGGPATAIPAVRVDDVVDTTGAGDIYVGTLAANLAAGRDITVAMEHASLAAAQSVTRRGAQARRLQPSESPRG